MLSAEAVAVWKDVIVILAAVAVITAAMRSVNWNPILGLLAVGAVIGPNGFGLLGESQGITLLAEIGVMFLLFKVGLELSSERIRLMSRWIFGLGSLHFTFAVVLGGLALWAVGWHWKSSVAMALGLALSSTAFVLQVLSERHELNSAAGRKIFAVLLLQDVAVAFILAVVPLLGAKADGKAVQILPSLLAMAIIFLVARFALLALLAKVRDRAAEDAFPASVLVVAMAMGLCAKTLGLSPSLGAFLAGLALADAEWRHDVKETVKPFQSTMLGVFFVSVGMVFPLQASAVDFFWIVVAAIGILAIKTAAGLVACLANGMRPRETAKVSIALAQGGEFSFVILAVAATSGLLTADESAFWTAAAVLTMALTPLLMTLASKIKDDAERLPKKPRETTSIGS
jgi:CPA2 family monovalent cation:H+ antiporter-2